MKKFLIVISVLICAEISFGQEVKISGSQTRKLTSSIVTGQEYELVEAETYGNTMSAKKL
jgi:hypothetical protein